MNVGVGLVVLARKQRMVRRQGRGGIIVHSSTSFDECSDVRRAGSHMLLEYFGIPVVEIRARMLFVYLDSF